MLNIMRRSLCFLAIVLPYNANAQLADAWVQYTQDPDRHPNIPNVSHAGYGGGDLPLPSQANTTLITVTDFGATPDDNTDDTDEIRDAIAEAAARAGDQPGGSVVFFPSGVYRLSGPLLIHDDRIQLRGFDRDSSVLHFTESLNDSYANYPGSSAGRLNWSFSGGLVWFTEASRNPYFNDVPTISGI
ncbi:MAG: glycosyl hydrolase family 28-related protein, partial [Planctomycetota bacterium]